MSKSRKLSWKRIDKRTIVTEEQRDGTPDFIVQHEGPADYWLKMRTSAKPYRFSTAREARDYAEGI